MPCASDSDCASGHCACQELKSLCVDQAAAKCPKPNWMPCETDADCENEVCGCNAGPEPKVCQPNADHPRECTAPPGLD